jgi:small-conductance mechanosensitive channel
MDRESMAILSSNSFNAYLLAILIFAIGAIVITIVNKILKKKVEELSQQPKFQVVNFAYSIFKKTFFPLIYYGLLIGSLSALSLPEVINKAVEYVGIILLTIAAIRFINQLIDYWFEILQKKKETTAIQIQGLKGLFTVAKVTVWIIGILIAVQNMGYNVSTAIAGLGVTGVAVVFAAQSILNDLFSYFSILFDKPFEPGDFIIIGDMSGTIQHIGVKTTRLTSLTGEQVIISNADLTNSRIKNYKRMIRRRIAYRIGFVYKLKSEQLKEIPNLIKEIITKVPNVTFDRAHFVEYGAYSLNFEIVYYVNSNDYLDYMDAHQAINLEIKRVFDEKGFDFAFPTQTIYNNYEKTPTFQLEGLEKSRT